MSAYLKNIESFYPLSPMQQGMLFHSLSAPESGVYVEQVGCLLRGELDVAAFGKAWQRVVDRHSVLRTFFMAQGPKEPVQAVKRDVAVVMEVRDVCAKNPAEQEKEFAEFCRTDRRQGFELSKPPLMRLVLMRTSATSHFFLWSHHHLLLDGWSVPMVLQEVMLLYEALRKGRTLRLPAPRPYRDYIVWLRKQDLSKAETFWRSLLKGFTVPTPLVVDRLKKNEGSDQPPSYAEQEIWLDAVDTATLETMARRHQLTPNTLMQGAWALLLSRYSGEEDVVFGATVSGRPAELDGVESMVGLFINTLPVRVQPSPAKTVSDYLKAIQVRAVEMRQYEYSSLIQIQGWSDVPRRMPLFESILVYENYPMTMAGIGKDASLEVRVFQSVEQTNYPLAVIGGKSDRFMVKASYDGNCFDAATIERMIGHLTVLLKSMAANPDGFIGALPLLAQNERQQLMVGWNATEAEYPRKRCLHELFEQQAAARPDAVAVIFENRSISYGELNQRANRLARYLMRLEVGPEVLVGICVERSIEMVVGLLGALKAGGAYVPLDPSYPSERLAYMIQDSRLPLLVTQETLSERLPLEGIRVIRLDADQAAIDRHSSNNPASGVVPQNLSYAIYTSGSTGAPKGTLLQHQGVCNFIHAHIQKLRVGAGSRILQFAAFSFDASVSEIFTALSSGATLCMASREILLSDSSLRDLMRSQSVTMAILPPSLLSLLEPSELPDLQIVISAGEACSLEIVKRWASGRRFFNGYGPTEASVGPLLYEVKDPLQEANPIPIGRPLSNQQAYVLNGQFQSQPVGVPGELYVGGVGLARGYHLRPELTAERFVPNPFSGAPGARLYRTGDLSRYRADGSIEFLGRIDEQVKVRGFRVELGEVEAALRATTGVSDAAVVAQGERLVAYLVSDSEPGPAAEQLRESLRQRLPDYMLPAAFVTMNQLPLSPSGKVDRRALSTLDPCISPARKPTIAPRDSLELSLAQIWEEVLQVKPVGIQDNFFELGGHSLLAIRLMARLKNKTGIDLSLVPFFREPTVENLARMLRQRDIHTVSSSLVPLKPEGRLPALYLVHPSGGMVHWYVQLARRMNSLPVYGLQAQGVNDTADLHTAVSEMATYYVKVIREFQPQGPYHIGSWSMGVVVAFEMALQLQAESERVGMVALIDQGPDCPADEPEDDAAYLVEVFGKHLSLSLEQLRRFNSEDQLVYVWETARKANWVYPEFTLPLFKQFVHVLRVHTNAMRQYVPKTYNGRVTLFRAAEQSDSSPPEADMGWGRLAAGGVDVQIVPGDHLSMLQEPYVEVLSERINACLKAFNSTS